MINQELADNAIDFDTISKNISLLELIIPIEMSRSIHIEYDVEYGYFFDGEYNMPEPEHPDVRLCSLGDTIDDAVSTLAQSIAMYKKERPGLFT